MVKKYGLVFDLERCIGCHACTMACKVENGMETISGIRVETVGGTHRDTPGGVFPNLSMHFLPIPCMHCDEPPCRDACPLDAIYQRSDGIVLVDEGKCDGCQACVAACPYQALLHDPERGIVRKCTLCFERLDEGFEPFCVRCCGVKAIAFGDLADPENEVSRLISQRNGYTLKALKRETGAGVHVYYCPPKGECEPPIRLRGGIGL